MSLYKLKFFEYDLDMTCGKDLYLNLTDADTSHLERPFASKAYNSPTSLITRSGKIYLGESYKLKIIEPSKEMLEGFVGLAYAPDEKILRYAQKWGLLDLCSEHRAPASHNQNCEPVIPSRQISFFAGEEGRRRYKEKLSQSGESLQDWRLYARGALSMLNITAKLHQGELGNSLDWKRANRSKSGISNKLSRQASVEERLRIEKIEISRGVNFWLQTGAVQTVFNWDLKQPRISFECSRTYGKLFGNLAIQLMLVVSQVSGLAICSACSTSYSPKRRPRNDQRNYCESCRVNAAWRDSQNAKRERDKRKK